MADAPEGWVNSHGDRRGAAAFVNCANLASVRNSFKVGQRKGKLTITEIDRSNPRRAKFSLQCDCGAVFKTGAYLSSIDACRACRPQKRIGAERKYHVKAGQYPLYRSWSAMKHRCNPKGKRKQNAHWAGRGIRVCAEWLTFPAFEKWSLENGYRVGLSLDRINVDGNYEPANCQWITRSENSKRCRAEYRSVRVRPPEINHYPIEMLWGAA